MQLYEAVHLREQCHDIWWTTLDVLFATHFVAETLKLVTPTTTKTCCAKCDFPFDHVYSNNAVHWNLMKITDVSLQLLEVQSEDYMTRDSALEVCGVLRWSGVRPAVFFFNFYFIAACPITSNITCFVLLNPWLTLVLYSYYLPSSEN